MAKRPHNLDQLSDNADWLKRKSHNSLKPTTVEALLLPSGQTVNIAKAMPCFTAWSGVRPADRYGQKLVLDFDGRMAFAELAILWSLEKAGWQGVWIDTYRKKFRRSYWDGSPMTKLPAAEPQSLLDSITVARSGKRGGAWDVFCWRGTEYLFAESKWKGHDRIRSSQLRWLEAALSIGLPLESFLIVEWTVAASATG